MGGSRSWRPDFEEKKYRKKGEEKIKVNSFETAGKWEKEGVEDQILKRKKTGKKGGHLKVISFETVGRWEDVGGGDHIRKKKKRNKEEIEKVKVKVV